MLACVVFWNYPSYYPLGLLFGKLSCTELNRKFSLTLDPPGEGLPDGTTLNQFRLLFHSAFPMISFIFSFVDEELNPLWKGTPFNNVVVKERFLQT